MAAVAMGITPAYLSLLERDLKGANLDHVRATLEKAANYYGVLPAYLLVDTPQAYMAEFVRSTVIDADRIGDRLRVVLDELHRRWGDDYSESKIAESMGIEPETLQSYKDGRIPLVDETVLNGLAAAIGVPVAILLSPIPSDNENPAIRRVINLAVESGIPVEELEHVIRAWMIARENTKKPSA